MNERAIFDAALDLKDQEQRSAYLNEVCGADLGLRQHIEGLLKAHEMLGSYLASPPAGLAPTIDRPPITEGPGTIIGPYKLLEQIGEGGFGTVFMAEQEQPVRRRVALKVIKPGMDSAQVIVRFEAERQALAMMDHANIARVLDAGTTGSGRPYFVMELVHGVPITKYCDDNRLTPRQRLELFVPVCQAIQHAHQKGIIHRDVKPSNVMITLYDGKPVPKVIDFGVAKATEQRLTERTLFTQYGTMVGTLEYMSPEQAEMSALGVDTRSDIFSLGVLLYELLTGSTPLSHKRVREAAYGEILRMIKEEEAPKPSMRLSDSGEALASISAQRHMEPAKLTKLVRGELDWIVMKTLEKDRNRRYETASAFAADVQRYLNDEAVQACPPSTWYRFRKFARRNRTAFVIAALAAAVLVLAVIGLTVGLIAVDGERQRTAQEQARTEAANARLQGNLQLAMQTLDEVYLKVAEEWLPRDPQRKKEYQELLVKALAFYEQFAGENATDPGVRQEVARAYRRAGDIHRLLGQPAKAKQACGRAIAVAEQLVAEFPADPGYRQELADMHHALVRALYDGGEFAEAEEHARRAFDLRARLVDEHPGVLAYRADLGYSHNFVGTLMKRLDPAAAAHYRKAIELLTPVIAEDPRVPRYQQQLAWTHKALGVLLSSQREPGAAEHLRRAIDLYTPLTVQYPNKSPHVPKRDQPDVPLCRRDLSVAHIALGQVLREEGDPAAAKHYSQGVEIAARLAADFPGVPSYRQHLAFGHLNFAHLRQAGGERTAAAEHYRLALDLLAKVVDDGPGVPEYQDRLACAHFLLADLLAQGGEAGETAEAAEHYRKGFIIVEELVSKWSGNAEYHRCLAWNLATCPDPLFREPARAVQAGRKAVELAPRNDGSWNRLGIAHYRAGDWEAAIAALEKAMQLKNGGDSWDWLFLAMAHWQRGEKEQARRWYDRAAPRMPTSAGAVRYDRFRAEAAALLGIENNQEIRDNSGAPAKH
jgi:serine/threonine protein kinase/tetratricopeptide (TPR) repeat protein